MGNCACTKDQLTESAPHKNKSLRNNRNKTPEILNEATDDDDYGGQASDLNRGSGGDEVCENLLRPNKKISMDDFEIKKVIGRGSFGKVYLVKRSGTENFYAMKKLKKEIVAKRNLFIKTQGK